MNASGSDTFKCQNRGEFYRGMIIENALRRVNVRFIPWKAGRVGRRWFHVKMQLLVFKHITLLKGWRRAHLGVIPEHRFR